MIRGEFTTMLPSGEEWIHPNNFTIYGVQKVIRAAFWNERTDWFVGLCARNPSDTISFESLNEPTIGVNGYARQEIPMDETGWPTISLANGEVYSESLLFTFTPDGGDFDKEINRLFLTDGDGVIAVSSAFPGGVFVVDVPLIHKYRLYFR